MKPTVSYSVPRLRFYADIIEPLAMNAVIEIIREGGVLSRALNLAGG